MLRILDVDHVPKPVFLRYGAAVLFISLVLIGRMAMHPLLGDESPYLAFFIAVALSAWYGGLLAGAFSTIVSAAAAMLILVDPETTLSRADYVNLLLFVGEGFLVSYLFHAITSSRRRLVEVLESISDGCSVVDRNGRLFYLNQRAAEIARHPRAELRGKNIWELYPELVNSEFERNIRQVMEQHKPTHFEFFHPVSQTWYLISAYSSREGVVIFTQDVTQIRAARGVVNEAREKVEKMNIELEQRVDERTAQMNSTIRELEAFSYSISHDLRAPLRAIDGFSKLLYDDYHEKLDDEGKRLIEIIRHNTLNMGHLIDGLLAFARLGRQQIDHSRVVMSDLVNEAVEEVQSSVNGRSVEFRVARELPNAEGDRILLRQVLINLLSNSVKFSRGRDPAVIEIGTKSDQSANTFFVRDNGVGFDSKYADKMFGVFQRLHAATEFEGTGLGLAIVQRIVTRHGGRVWAEGTPGAGAAVYFSLPKPSVK